MPINVYTGLMRSGKSYEVVAEVIVPAVASGRRVVTNVDGISSDLICAYARDQLGGTAESLGHVVHVSNADVFSANFFPYYGDKKDVHIDTTVRPGDLVVIDEAWRFWPSSGGKISKEHMSFFLEHGHFTHPDTGVCCDLVLMIQDMGTLHRQLKAVVAFSFRTHKKVSLGLSKVYSVNMFEGAKQSRAAEIGAWVRKYKPDVFPLYSSFSGGVQGKTVNVDARQNIFAQKKLWFMAAFVVVTCGWALNTVWGFFHPKKIAAQTVVTASDAAVVTPILPIANLRAVVPFSDSWRVSGTLTAKGVMWVVLVGPAGVVRLESPSMFDGAGMVQVGQIDGARVTTFSGSTPRNQGSPAAGPLPLAQGLK